MTVLSLAACGAVLSALLLMGGSADREADALDDVWARGLVPAACVAPGPSQDAAAPLADAIADAGCVASRRPWQPPGGDAAATAALAAEPAAEPPASAKPPSLASRPPTYIRIHKPRPRPDPGQLALEGLRGGI